MHECALKFTKTVALPHCKRTMKKHRLLMGELREVEKVRADPSDTKSMKGSLRTMLI